MEPLSLIQSEGFKEHVDFSPSGVPVGAGVGVGWAQSRASITREAVVTDS